MMQPPSFNSSNAASEAAAALVADHRPRPPADPTPPPAEASWLSANREVAEAVLEDAKRDLRPAHRRMFTFIDRPASPVADPLVMRLMTLPSFRDRQRGQVPAGPELLYLASPEPGTRSGMELLQVLSAHSVDHLVTMGDLPVSWLPAYAPRPRTYSVNNTIGPTLLVQTGNAQPWGNGWSSTLSLRSSNPARDGTSLATVVQRLHVPAHAVELLSPESLQSVADWVQAHSQPGARVALMAVNNIPPTNQEKEPFPLRRMADQVALTMALRQGGTQSGRHDPHARVQRQQLLADAACELYLRSPALMAGISQLSAVLEADRLGPAGSRGDRPPPARPVSPVGPDHPATRAQPPMPAGAEAVPTPETHSSAADIRSDEVIAINELPPWQLARPSRYRFE